MVRFPDMNKTLTVLLLAATAVVNAQYRRQPVPSPFDAFISKPGIEWAAYAVDTFHFADFNNTLIQRFKRKEIKAALPVYRGVSDLSMIKYISSDSLNSIALYPVNVCPIIDSGGNMLFDPASLKPYPVDSSKYSQSRFNQILYVENGVVKSFIPWVNVEVIGYSTSSGIFLGYGAYLSTCFLSDYTGAVLPKKSKMISLSTTSRHIQFDSVDAEDRLKETYGRNLIETLWPYVMKDQFKLYAYEKRKNIKAADIRHLREYLQLPVPRFDSLGNMQTSFFADLEVNPSIFKYADLVQEWYYDVTKNMVVNKVKELILMGFKGEGDKRRFFPVLKLIF
jgi:hypothetical protein